METENALRDNTNQDLREAVLEEIRAIAMARGTDFLQIRDGQLEITDTDALPPHLGAAIAAAERSTTGLKLKFYDKLRALELLGKAYGVFDQIPQTGSGDSLLRAIVNSTRGEVDTGDIPEIQQAAAAGDDLVEQTRSSKI